MQTAGGVRLSAICIYPVRGPTPILKVSAFCLCKFPSGFSQVSWPPEVCTTS